MQSKGAIDELSGVCLDEFLLPSCDCQTSNSNGECATAAFPFDIGALGTIRQTIR
jgi:hypothetical protein